MGRERLLRWGTRRCVECDPPYSQEKGVKPEALGFETTLVIPMSMSDHE